MLEQTVTLHDHNCSFGRVFAGENVFPEERKWGKGLLRRIGALITQPHVLHETLPVLAVRLRCHPHVAHHNSILED